MITMKEDLLFCVTKQLWRIYIYVCINVCIYVQVDDEWQIFTCFEVSVINECTINFSYDGSSTRYVGTMIMYLLYSCR